MHIAEGYLPVTHAAAWTLLAAPAVVWSHRSLDLAGVSRHRRLLLAASAGFLFALTALKFPSVAGSSSHPTGIVLGTILLGMRVMPVLAALVLVFQALLLAHGGLTTLGANVFSLGIAGPLAVAFVGRLQGGLRLPDSVGLVLATVAGSFATYATTAVQLAVAFPDPASGVTGSLGRFMAVFAVAQVPVALLESLFTVMVWKSLPLEMRTLETQ